MRGLNLFPWSLRHAVDRRRTRYAFRGILLEQLKRFLHGPFDLRIAPFDYFGRRIFHFDVRRDAYILDVPFSLEIVKRQARRGDAAAVNRRGGSKSAYERAPGSSSH